jgi:hypothetical protein
MFTRIVSLSIARVEGKTPNCKNREDNELFIMENPPTKSVGFPSKKYIESSKEFHNSANVCLVN